jgi:Dak1 domain
MRLSEQHVSFAHDVALKRTQTIYYLPSKTKGIHGEPGIQKGPIQSADALADVMIDAILAPSRGVAKKEDKVAVLINNFGSKCCIAHCIFPIV